MKILRIINSLAIGGAERSVVGNLPLHKKNGLDIEVLLLNGKKTFFLNQLKKDNIKVHSLGIDNNIYNPFLIIKLCKIIKNYDIIHAHLFPSLYWVAIAKFLVRSKVKLVFTEHSTHNRRKQNWFLRRIDKFIYSQYNVVIAISEAASLNLKESLEKNDKPEIVTINNGVDFKKLKQESLIVNKELKKKYINKKIVLQIAAFRPEKDQETLIKSLLYLPEEYYVFFVGDGERRVICEKLVESLGFVDRVLFLGFQENVGSVISLADIVIMSSHWEGFGRAAVEAMALDKPVIATNVPGLRDVVDNAGLLFDVGDSEHLSKLILSLKDMEYYNLISRKCEERSKLYNIEFMVSAYEDVYKKVYNKVN